ncbi:helix-turn-helix transcriptional regulator [Chitinophaga oryzae]|uniref:Helix-turn-helix transcriptional regulator n=1 Tax=Chitinophaga oryzae TaxID=2725414 RepID=A0AAE7DBR6_9BACT|nr:helix-turn-helix domain-containing protein [Chitinophaga oryzae]QJB35869.1 helix-turn-helix transcriptional regulator [Chitinophaga oryzae]QJB42394.1 helix-turn-helix transcriptional regulator [Chitinophaga oryzae]
MSSKIKASSSNAHNLQLLAAAHDVNDILRMISARWKMELLCNISIGVNQFSRLKEKFPSLSDQILGKRLSEMVNEGLIVKEYIADTVPPQTLYRHTDKAKALMEILQQLHVWGNKSWE